MPTDKPQPTARKPQQPSASRKKPTPRNNASAVSEKKVLVQMRDEFNKDRVFQMFIITLMTAVVFSLYLFILYYRFNNRPKPVYFEAQRVQGQVSEATGKKILNYRLIKPSALGEPQVGKSELLIWAGQSLGDIFSFNFQNADAHMARAKHYFTEDGWSEFNTALTAAGLIEQVKRGRYIVNARAIAPPLLQRQGQYQGRFEWHLDVDLYVRYRSSLADNRQRWKIKLIAVRTPVTDDQPRGVAIDYFKVESVRATI